jgi:predicted transposase/invertase (TIGR01784 family)
MNKRWEKIIDPDFCKRYDAAKKWDEDVKKAKKQGLKEGIGQGINQGLSKTAAAMKAGGEAIDKIMRYTGLSRREIMGL